MKKNILSLFSAVVLCANAGATADTVGRYMVRTVPAPNMVLTDSVDALGKKIDRSTLLSVSVNTDFSSVAHNIVNANPLVITKPTENHTIGLAGFNVYSTLFTNASLTIATDAPAEVYIDNKQVTSKSDKENSCVVPLLLEPMRLYQVAVKMLVSATDSVNATLTSSISAENENASVVITTDNKRFYQLTDNFIGTRVRSVGISPCGKYLLTSYTSRTDTKTSANYSILTDTKTGKQIAPRFTSPVQWMPKSSKLYFTTPTTTGQDINTFDPQTGKTEVLAHNVPKTGYFYIAPTEDFMVYAIEESALKSQGPLTRHASTMDRVDGRGRYHIALYNFATAASTRLTAGNHSAHLQDISNDGKRILFSKHTTDYSHRQQLRVDLYQIDLTTMTTDTLLAHQWFFNTASFSPDASQVLITAGPDAFNGIGRNCGNLPIANDYDNQAFILDIASRDIKPITKLFDPSLTSANWNSNGNIYMCAKERDIETIYEYNPVRNTYTRLNTATEMARGLSLSDNGQMAAYTGMGLDHSTRAYIYDMRKAKSTLVADPMAETYTKLELGKVEDFEFSYDSTVIDGFICYPPQFDESKKYPMIVYYYAGTTPSQRWNEYYYGPHLFASRGYVVYVLNPSGTIGYGQEFSARHVNAWGRRTADEIIRGTQLVCQKYSFIDQERIGCIGASYGGFMTQYLQTLTNMFACAVSHAGISNVTSYWGEGFWGVGYNTVAAADSYPWTDAELFTKQGSLFNADKINTPLLLLHGNKDTNVPIGESIQLYNALKIQNKEVEFIEVDGENHTIVADLDKQILWHNTIMAWFARWLQNAPEWWNTLYPKVMTE